MPFKSRKKSASSAGGRTVHALRQARVEGLTLLVADNPAGYFGVQINNASNPCQGGKPYEAQVSRGGKIECLGHFATAEEAALCVARTPEGQEAAMKAAAPPLTSEEAWQQAQAEGLTLLRADNTTGYFGVEINPGQPNPYKAKVRFLLTSKTVWLGCFATAEEAALCVARSPEGQAAAKRAPASEAARQQAQAEGLTLLVADNKTGYFGVTLDKKYQPDSAKPFEAQVSRGGKTECLGHFATAEEAALCVARTPEGQEAAVKAAAAGQAAAKRAQASEAARQQAQAEGLTLLVADNKTGYFGVKLDKKCQPNSAKPYQAQVSRDGKKECLGHFATAEEAALCVTRQEAAMKAAAPPLTSEEVQQQAQAEGLTLRRHALNKTGYFRVFHRRGKSKPYEARGQPGQPSLGMFATAEEAALYIARSREGRKKAGRAAAARRRRSGRRSEAGQGNPPAMPSGAVLKEEGAVPPMPPGAFVKEEQVAPPPMPPGAFCKAEDVVPPMPPDAIVKREHGAVVKEEEQECSHGRPKRKRK